MTGFYNSPEWRELEREMERLKQMPPDELLAYFKRNDPESFALIEEIATSVDTSDLERFEQKYSHLPPRQRAGLTTLYLGRITQDARYRILKHIREESEKED